MRCRRRQVREAVGQNLGGQHLEYGCHSMTSGNIWVISISAMMAYLHESGSERARNRQATKTPSRPARWTGTIRLFLKKVGKALFSSTKR